MRMAICLALTATACGGGAIGNEIGDGHGAALGNRVATSGKTELALSDVPPDVLLAAQMARPGFVATGAETETRDGRRYFDIEGRTADGAEIEFDIMQDANAWRVVETQRDIEFAAAPQPVQAAARGADSALAPTRVIESVQADGLVIYEVYQGERKLEIRWDGTAAEVLAREWQH